MSVNNLSLVNQNDNGYWVPLIDSPCFEDEPMELPEPPSCYPDVRIVAPNNHLAYPWPEDLSYLGITVQERDFIDKTLASVKDSEFQFRKKILLLCAGQRVLNFVPLPLSCSSRKVKKSDGSESLIWTLFSKTLFAKGVERKIRYAYETTGEFKIKKRLVDSDEHKIINFMNKVRDSEGRSMSQLMFRKNFDKQGKEKFQSIEPIRDGTLDKLFDTNVLNNILWIETLFYDLIFDLKSLHSLKQNIGFVSGESYTYSTYHGDIKFDNALFYKDSNPDVGYRAELSDFGATMKPNVLVLSTGFVSPEAMRFYREQKILENGKDPNLTRSDNTLVEFAMQDGQARDIWALGLVLIALLVGRKEQMIERDQETESKIDIAPLECLKKYMSCAMIDQRLDYEIVNITQEEIDAELVQYKEEALQRFDDRDYVDRLFAIVGQMLQVDPEKRASAASLYQELPSTLFLNAFFGSSEET